MRFLPSLLAVVFAAGCGKEIGDACIVSSDCDPAGQRQCDTSQKEGYCTIQGCDYDTCPSEGECVRFFTGQFNNKTCNPMTEDVTTDDCSLDELCALTGHCVARSSEVRYCMRTCSTNGDCRDGYECRKLTQAGSNDATFEKHGGEPVLAPGVFVSDTTPGFCATKPAS
ncbi:MAG TPA: hypothetical protein VLT45_25120 [Kofleriaceae bacterium]|nr:hypothetical protein [Kofleriaceae bacterium]